MKCSVETLIVSANWASFMAVGALAIGCSDESTPKRVEPTPCEADVDCGGGAACSKDAPLAFGLQDQTQSVCWNEECEEDFSHCGTPDDLCGLCVCKPSCDDKVCGETNFDGCNGLCPHSCEALEAGCLQDYDCPIDHQCLLKVGALFGQDAEVSVCVPEFCTRDDDMYRSECGFEGALCGSACAPEPESCPDMECGTDPYTGESCGTCPEGTVCNLEKTCSLVIVQCAHDTCRDGADIALSPELGVGEYQVEVSNGTDIESCTIEIDELSYFTSCTKVLPVRVRPAQVFVEGDHKQLSIRVHSDGNTLAQHVFELEYGAYRPNGDDCEPECQVAFAEIPLN